MTLQNSISSGILIRDNEIILDGQSVFQAKDALHATFFQLAYEALNINYPKFFRMDNLSKAGFLAAELLLRDKDLSAKYTAEEMGVVFSTANSSLDTDLRYLESVKAIASPSLFVYTLPNIVVGEICIRQGIKGENACFIFDIFDAAFQTNYANQLLDSGVVKMFVSGWADFYNDKFEAFFYLVERTETNPGRKHDPENVRKIYSGTWNN